MKPRKWYQISIQIDAHYQDLLVGQLTILDFSGFLQEDKSLKCFIASKKWTSTIHSKFESTLKRSKQEFPIENLTYTIKSIPEKNWNKTWEKQTGIIRATSQIVIKPSWKKLPKHHSNKTILHIDPKMSFGTGHHETTRLSLKLLEKFLQQKMKVLDFGCGTGVLGIACVKLGATSVTAVDIDPWAIENTQENIKRNHVNNRMTVRLGSVSVVPRLKYDLVVANIDYYTISRFIKSIVARTHKKSTIILSGILTSDIPALLALCEKNQFIPAKLISENEWSAAALCRIL